MNSEMTTDILKRVIVIVIFFFVVITISRYYIGRKYFSDECLESERYDDEAIEAYRRTLRDNPNDFDAQFSLGRACIYKILEFNYWDYEVKLMLPVRWKSILTSFETDMVNESLSAFEKAVELDPLNADVHYWIGLAYSSKMMREEAADAFKKSLSLNPDNTKCHYLLSLYYVSNAESLVKKNADEAMLLLESAQKEVDEALKLEPDLTEEIQEVNKRIVKVKDAINKHKATEEFSRMVKQKQGKINSGIPGKITNPLVVLNRDRAICGLDFETLYSQKNWKETSIKGGERLQALKAIGNEVWNNRYTNNEYEWIIPLLIEVLMDPFSYNSREASSVLSKIGQRAVPFLVSAIEDKNTSNKMLYEIVNTLGSMNFTSSFVEKRGKVVIPGECVPVLVDTLRNHSERDIRRETLKAIRLVEDTNALGAAVPVLVEVLKDPGQVPKGTYGRVLRDKSYGVRFNTFEILSKITDEKALEPAVPVFTEILDGKYDPNHSVNAMKVLSRAGRDGAKSLVKCLKTDNEYCPKIIAANLNAHLIQALIEALPDGKVRKKAVNLLLKIRDKKHIPLLIDGLDYEDKNVRKNVLPVLRKLTGRNFSADYQKWKTWWEEEKDIVELRWQKPTLGEIRQNLDRVQERLEKRIKESEEKKERGSGR